MRRELQELAGSDPRHGVAVAVRAVGIVALDAAVVKQIPELDAERAAYIERGAASEAPAQPTVSLDQPHAQTRMPVAIPVVRTRAAREPAIGTRRSHPFET